METTTKHTPGEWYYDRGRYVRMADTDGTIALVCETDGHVDPRYAIPQPVKANGYLIAAAPAMLEALELVDRAELGFQASLMVEAAIALARGEK